jgi:hypothetical protein
MAAVTQQSYKCIDQYNNKKAYCDYDETLSADVVAKVSTGVYRAHLVNTKTVLPLHYGEPIRRHQYPMQHTIKPNEQILQIPITIKNTNNVTSPLFVQQIPISIIETTDTIKSKDYALNDNFNEIYKKNLRKLSTNERQRQLFFKNRPENSNQSSPVRQEQHPDVFTATTPNSPNDDQRFDLQPNVKHHQRDIPSVILSKLSTFAVNVQQKAQMFNNRSSGANPVAATSLLSNQKRFHNGLGINLSPTSTYTTSSTNSPASSPTSSISSINNLNLNTTESKKLKARSQTWFYDEVCIDQKLKPSERYESNTRIYLRFSSFRCVCVSTNTCLMFCVFFFTKGDDFWCSLKDEKKSKFKLTKINLKSLNIIELIHLKQICLAKLHRSLNNFQIAMPKGQ